MALRPSGGQELFVGDGTAAFAKTFHQKDNRVEEPAVDRGSRQFTSSVDDVKVIRKQVYITSGIYIATNTNNALDHTKSRTRSNVRANDWKLDLRVLRKEKKKWQGICQ